MEKLNKEDRDFIISLSEEMNTQDNMSTAQPFALVLRTEEREYLPDGFGDYVVAVYDSEEFTTPAELADYFDLENKNDFDSFEDVIEFIDESEDFSAGADDFDMYCARTSQVISEQSVNFFLTHKAFDKYVEANRHNLNKPSRYGIHLYRNREMDSLYRAIHNIAKLLKEDL